MNKDWIKYLLIFFLLVTYINRGLFVSSPEAEPIYNISETTHGEVNSLIEFIHNLISGHENGVDEDGDFPEAYHFAKIVQPVIDQSLMQCIELRQPVTYINNTPYPANEIKFPSPNYGTIDHPPEKA